MTNAVRKLSEILMPYGLTLFYAVDPGAFSAMRPVYEALQAENRSVRWVLDGWSLATWGAELEHWTIDAFQSCKAPWNADRSAMIIGSQVDFAATHRMIRKCFQRGIDSFFLFDHWSNYRKHFLNPSDGRLVLPYAICLMDQFAAQSMISILAGQRGETQLMVVGHPALEAQVQDIQNQTEDKIRALRQGWGAESGILQAFLLEPIEADFSKDQLGYTETTILEYFFRNLVDSSATVVVRPHPRQDINEVRHRLSTIDTRDAKIVVSDIGSTPELISAADEVYGMTSIALILSIWAGKPTCSIQVGRNEFGRKLSNPQLEEIVIT